MSMMPTGALKRAAREVGASMEITEARGFHKLSKNLAIALREIEKTISEIERGEAT